MFKILLIMFISLFFISCTSKNSAFKYFEKEDIETKGIKLTKKIDILKNEEVEVIFWATYLNKIEDNFVNNENEEFLISLYFANSTSQDINKKEYKVLLNEKESLSIEKIERDNQKYKDLMLKNYWGNYYLVKFNSSEDTDKLELKITNQKSSSAQLNFEK
uniref:hypothetical protein n=1 Tax=Aliarcobacter sp. TaxID=2321116 RepID=UPI0040472EC0